MINAKIDLLEDDTIKKNLFGSTYLNNEKIIKNNSDKENNSFFKSEDCRIAFHLYLIFFLCVRLLNKQQILKEIKFKKVSLKNLILIKHLFTIIINSAITI